MTAEQDWADVVAEGSSPQEWDWAHVLALARFSQEWAKAGIKNPVAVSLAMLRQEEDDFQKPWNERLEYLAAGIRYGGEKTLGAIARILAAEQPLLAMALLLQFGGEDSILVKSGDEHDPLE